MAEALRDTKARRIMFEIAAGYDRMATRVRQLAADLLRSETISNSGEGL